jgi:diguanylate cyclase (GGDEF)-like protein
MVLGRDTLVLVLGAAIGAALALALREAHPFPAAATGALGGAAVGTLIGRRVFGWQAMPVRGDPRDARIRDLEAELANEKDLRKQAEEREATAQRFLSDLEMTRSVLEEQASQSVELAEELAEQKTELERSKQRSDYLALHDLLTGLPNRRAFQEELRIRVERAAANGRSLALLFVDLDKFKDLNDTLGHDAGDMLLTKVAGVLDAAMRGDDFAARLGGDEFAIIIEAAGHFSRQTAYNVAERLRLALQFPVPSPKGEIPVGATIGVALYPYDASDAAGLLCAADQVMYAGKRCGRNRVVMTEDVKAQQA